MDFHLRAAGAVGLYVRTAALLYDPADPARAQNHAGGVPDDITWLLVVGAAGK